MLWNMRWWEQAEKDEGREDYGSLTKGQDREIRMLQYYHQVIDIAMVLSGESGQTLIRSLNSGLFHRSSCRDRLMQR